MSELVQEGIRYVIHDARHDSFVGGTPGYPSRTKKIAEARLYQRRADAEYRVKRALRGQPDDMFRYVIHEVVVNLVPF